MTNIAPKIDKPFFIMLVGVPCSGKSTWLQREFSPYLADIGVYADILSTDEIVDYVAAIKRKKYTDVFNDIIPYATSIIESRTFLSSYVGMNIVLDQTNVSVASRKRKIEMLADPQAYFKIAITFDEAPALLHERNSTRDKRLDPIVIDNMLERFKPVTKAEDFDDIMTPKEFKLKYMPVIKKQEEVA